MLKKSLILLSLFVCSISFAGQTVTGLLYVTGNVGVSTILPDGKLTIKGAGNSSGKALNIRNSNNTEVFTVFDNGNVGIGTSPTEKLGVLGNVSAGESSSQKIQSTTGKIDLCGIRNINNECIDVDMETDANRVSFNPTDSGITSVDFPLIVKQSRVLAGGVDQVNYNINQGGVTSGLVSYYKMEDNTTTSDVVNEVGTNTGTAPTNTEDISTTGKLNKGFHLTSSSTQYIDLGSNASLKMAGDLTIAFWFRTSTTGTTMRIMGNRSASGDNVGWEVSINTTGQALMQVDTSAGLVSITGSSIINDGQWYYVIAKRSSSSLILKINNVSESTPTGSSSGDSGTAADNTYIGRTPFTAQYYNGDLDDLRIFNRATTDDEDSTLWNSGNGNDVSGSGSNVIFLKMEDSAASTTVTDTVGVNTVTASRNTSNFSTTGLIGNAFHFTSASSDYLDLGSSSTLKFVGDFTVNFWMRTSTSGIMRLSGNRSASGTNIGFDISKNASNVITFIVDEGTNSYSVTGTTNLIDSAWHMITARRRGSTLSIWVDDTSEGTPTGSTSADIGTSADNTYVGRTPFSANYFNGDIDSYTEFDRAISDDDIAVLNNGGRGNDSLSGSTTPLVHMFTNLRVAHPVYTQVSTSDDVFIGDDLEADGTIFSNIGMINKGNMGIGTDNLTSRLSIVGGNVGIGTWIVNGGNLIVNGGGNIGFGTAFPGRTLDVFGDIRASNGGKFYGDGSPLTGIISTQYWVAGNVGINTTSNVGIGTINPGKLLTVFGDMRLDNSGKYYGDGSTLTGITATAAPAGGTGAVQYNSAGSAAGTEAIFSFNGTNVGLGTTNGTRGLLDVRGNVLVSTNLGIGTTTPNTALWLGNGVFTVTSGGTTAVTSTNTTTAPITLTANSLSTASGINASSSNTTFSGRGLINSTLSGSSSNMIGSALFAAITGSSATAARVVEFADATANDTTPFSIDSNNGNVGIGTITPQAQLDIRFQTPTNPFQIGSSSTDSTGAWVRVDNSGNVGIGTIAPSSPLSVTGHIHSHGTSPSVASNDCGTTAQGTVVTKSTDVAGSFTVGTLAVTSCAITFNSTWLNAPQCIVIDDSNILAVKAATTTTKLTVSATTSISGDVISYICVGNE